MTFEHGSWFRLVLGDWREYSDLIREAQPVACITDPPYGLRREHAAAKPRPSPAFATAVRNRDARGDHRMVGDDAPGDVSDVFGLAPETIMFGADHLRRSLPERGRFLVWDKLGGKESWGVFSDAEMAFWTRPGRVMIHRQVWKGACSGSEPNKLAKRWHPTQKPTKLMRWCIELTGVPQGALIVDPYAGGCSTAIACWQTDRRFLGFEIDRKWFDLACERIATLCPVGMFD